MSKKALLVKKNGRITARVPKTGKENALKLALETAGYEYLKTVAVPSIATLERWSNDGVSKAVDGCKIEPDGTCNHGAPSWLMALGYI